MTKLGAGGISTLTVNINELIDLNKIKFDYLVFEDEHTFYEDRVKQYGAEKKAVDVTEYIDRKLLLYWKKYQLTKKMLKKENYDVMHIDASTPMDVVIGLAAKHAGVKVRILHSHIAGDNKKSVFRSFYLNCCRLLMLSTITDYFAISNVSAAFMFPKKIARNHDFTIIKNGIIADRYVFDEKKRICVRSKLGIEKQFVFGHIGRFSEEKNHIFLIDVYAQICRKRSDTVLLLIGDGILKDKIIQECHKKGIANKVIFYGTTTDVPDILCGMDSFIFPSRYEGLGIAAVEAQCSGLPTFCSQGVPEEAKVSELFHTIEGYDPIVWADKILKKCTIKNRHDHIALVKEKGYDIALVAKELQDFYLGVCSKPC